MFALMSAIAERLPLRRVLSLGYKAPPTILEVLDEDLTDCR